MNMNFWPMIFTVGKILVWLVLAIISAVGISMNVTTILNDLAINKKKICEGPIFGLIVWLVLMFISLYYLLSIFNGLGASL